MKASKPMQQLMFAFISTIFNSALSSSPQIYISAWSNIFMLCLKKQSIFSYVIFPSLMLL